MELKSSKDLLLKCIYEFEKLDTSQKEYEYALFNIIVSLNHLYEWVKEDESVESIIKQKCISEFHNFDMPKTNEIRLLANSLKHFNKSKISTMLNTETSELGAGDKFMECGHPDAISGNQITTYSININNEQFELSDLLAELIGNWKIYLLN